MPLRYEQIIRKSFEVRGTSGKEFLCRCPWHDDQGKPNLYVNGEKGMFLCHSCGKKGHLKNITADLPRLTTDDMRERLRGLRSSDDDPGGRVYGEEWLDRFDFPHDYWLSRGFSPETIEQFQLGYDPMEDRVTIPIRNVDGQCLGVIQRALDGSKPKYRYPKGFPIGKHMFGAWLVNDQRKVALVEGSLDAIACWDARVPALAMYGSRITHDQKMILRRLGIKTVVIFTDNDGPGQDAIEQVHETLEGSGIAVRVVVYRSYWNDKDPADLTPERRRKAYHSALPWHRWAV